LSSPRRLRVVAVPGDVLLVLDQLLGDGLLGVGGPGAQAGDAVDHLLHEVEAVHLVEHHHVERRGGRALLLVAAHVQVGMVGAAVGEPVDQPRVAVVGEDDRHVRGEQRVEVLV
jgi:hypothetical protein